MTFKHLIAYLPLFITWGLASCASAPPDQYIYQLPLQFEDNNLSTEKNPSKRSSNTVNIHTADKILIVIESVKLADFLDQPGIAVNLPDNKIQIAKHHLWAQRLNQRIPQIVLSDLDQLLDNRLYFVQNFASVPIKTEKKIDISLQIDQFNAAAPGPVTVSGVYHFNVSGANTPMLKRPFVYQHPPEQEGYNNAVLAFRQNLHQLSKQIAKDIKNIRFSQ